MAHRMRLLAWVAFAVACLLTLAAYLFGDATVSGRAAGVGVGLFVAGLALMLFTQE